MADSPPTKIFLVRITILGLVFLGTATLGSTILPSSWCMGKLSTFSTAAGSLNVMKPKPRDRRVAGSFITMTSASSPNMEKYSRMLSGVVCHDSPPMNILPGSLGMSPSAGAPDEEDITPRLTPGGGEEPETRLWLRADTSAEVKLSATTAAGVVAMTEEEVVAATAAASAVVLMVAEAETETDTGRNAQFCVGELPEGGEVEEEDDDDEEWLDSMLEDDGEAEARNEEGAAAVVAVAAIVAQSSLLLSAALSGLIIMGEASMAARTDSTCSDTLLSVAVVLVGDPEPGVGGDGDPGGDDDDIVRVAQVVRPVN